MWNHNKELSKSISYGYHNIWNKNTIDEIKSMLDVECIQEKLIDTQDGGGSTNAGYYEF